MHSTLHLRHFCVWEIIKPKTISGPKRKTEFQEYKWSGVGETTGARFLRQVIVSIIFSTLRERGREGDEILVLGGE